MITLPRTLLRQIENAAEAAYPNECCGLLIGSGLTATRVAESPNAAEGDKTTRFEASPQLRFDVMRRLEGSGEDIIGHYHSHPGHPAIPSKHDRDMAFEPGLVWLITSVINGKTAETRAYRVDEESKGFKEATVCIQ